MLTYIYVSGYLVLVYTFFSEALEFYNRAILRLNIFVPRLERCPLGLCVFFVLASNQPAST